jgi:hypothetical protein
MSVVMRAVITNVAQPDNIEEIAELCIVAQRGTHHVDPRHISAYVRPLEPAHTDHAQHGPVAGCSA